MPRDPKFQWEVAVDDIKQGIPIDRLFFNSIAKVENLTLELIQEDTKNFRQENEGKSKPAQDDQVCWRDKGPIKECLGFDNGNIAKDKDKRKLFLLYN